MFRKFNFKLNLQKPASAKQANQSHYDCYQLLGVSPKAKPMQIDLAFRQFEKEYNAQIEKTPKIVDDFNKVKAAYRLLMAQPIVSVGSLHWLDYEHNHSQWFKLNNQLKLLINQTTQWDCNILTVTEKMHILTFSLSNTDITTITNKLIEMGLNVEFHSDLNKLILKQSLIDAIENLEKKVQDTSFEVRPK